MDLSIQQLRMLREVSRRGTIAAAATQLGYSPSAVSQQLSSAEKVTGVAMLERVGRNVLLTDAGRELVVHADRVLEQLDFAQAAIERVQGDVAGVIRLGFMESVGSTMLGPIMRKVRSAHPDLQLRTALIDGLRPDNMVRAGELDVSFVVQSHRDAQYSNAGFEHDVLCRDWFRLAVPTEWFEDRGAPSTIALGSVAGEDFIAPPIDDACGLAAVEACRDAGLDPFVAHRIADYPTTLRVVAGGFGLALVPDLGIRNVPDGVTIVDLDHPKSRTIELMYRSSSAERPATRALVEVIKGVADDLHLDRS